jgi:hypothetical protein
MSFASPFFLLGAAAISVPVIIHLIGRHRAPRRSFAALDFVLRCDRRLARRVHLRQLLLLAVRALLVAGIAVMMAKPYSEVESDLPALGGGAQSAALILDDTLSMRRRVAGQTLFYRAQARAQEIVTHLGGGADVAVLQLSRPSRPLVPLTRDARKVRSAIDSMKAGYRHATLGPALVQAARILAGSVLPERHIFVLSDMAAHGWAASPEKLAGGAQLHFVDLARGLDPENHAVVDLSAVPAEALGPRSMRIVARVCNFRGKAVTLRVTLSIEDKQVARGLQPLEPWACADKAFQHTFQRGGVYSATVSLDGDDLREDDERYLVTEVESQIRVLLVNGAPNPIRHRDELFYLEAALHPPGVRGQPILAKSIPVNEPGQLQFSLYDVVVLCNVATLPEPRRAELDAFVRRGGGLLLAPGDNVDPESFNRALGDLLPQRLRGPVSAAPPGSGESALRVGRIDGEHPIFSSIWTEADGAGLRSARFFRVYQLSPDTRTDRKVLLWYEDGAPALLETRRGQGRVLLFTSTLDRDWSDLPIRPGYLPLVQQMIRYLSRVPLQGPRRSVYVGTTESFELSKGTKEVRLSGPSGIDHQWSKRQLAGKENLEIPVDAPGFYQLAASGHDGVLRPLDRESFVANVDARESDLRQTGQPGQGPRVPLVRAKQRVELWHAVSALLLILLLGEAVLVRRG